jgi:hypothetical protein
MVECLAITHLFAARDDNAAAGPARTGDTAVVSALGDSAVGTGGAGSNSLPNNLTIVAKAELSSAVADNFAVLGASSSRSAS